MLSFAYVATRDLFMILLMSYLILLISAEINIEHMHANVIVGTRNFSNFQSLEEVVSMIGLLDS